MEMLCPFFTFFVSMLSWCLLSCFCLYAGISVVSLLIVILLDISSVAECHQWLCELYRLYAASLLLFLARQPSRPNAKGRQQQNQTLHYIFTVPVDGSLFVISQDFVFVILNINTIGMKPVFTYLTFNPFWSMSTHELQISHSSFLRELLPPTCLNLFFSVRAGTFSSLAGGHWFLLI